VLVDRLPTGERFAVAQETAVRDELAKDSALRTVLPMLILVPILLLVVADIVRKLLQPVASLAADIEGRGDGELHALPEQGLPTNSALRAGHQPDAGACSETLEGQRRPSPTPPMNFGAQPPCRCTPNGWRDPSCLLRRGNAGRLRSGIERGRALLGSCWTMPGCSPSARHRPAAVARRLA
jgi:two-component system OmpR family sensor kinase